MPVEFDDYDPSEPIAVTEDSVGFKILRFLAQNPDMGYTPSEIHDNVNVARGSIGTTLQRLHDRNLVEHKEPYWSAGPDDRLAAFASAITTTAPDDGDDRLPPEDPEDWRVADSNEAE